MATATEYTTEQLNYYRICYVATDILPEGLRSIFKREWDNRYMRTKGEWKDEPRNGMDFRNAETPKKQKRNAHLLNTMTNGNRFEWDCTMLFYAILFSDCIGSTLKRVVQSNVDDLRRFRNEEFAHMSRGQLSDGDFQNAIGKVHGAFQALGLSTVQIHELAKQTTFPTKELNDVLNKVEDLKKKLQDNEKQKQNLADQLQQREEQLQVLEDQLQNDSPSFCILPPKPSHDIAGRNNEVTEINQQLKELKQADEKTLSSLFMSGNPGSGKSQLAGLVAKQFFDDAQDDPNANAFVMTMNAESLDTLLQSYFSFARHLKCPEYSVSILQSKDLKTDEKINQLKTLISTKVTSYSSWLLVVDNTKSISQVLIHLPRPGNEQWARGQLLITTQDTESIPSPSSSIGHISLKEGMKRDDACSLLANLSGIVPSNIELDVAKALDYQPLALASAATYVEQLRQSKSHFDWNNFLEKLEKGQRSTTETILADTNPSYSKSMTEATKLAVNEIVQSDKVIKQTLSFLSLCAPEPLSQDIVINYILNVDEEIEDKEMIIMRIRRCSLILLQEEDGDIYIGVHQVVRDAIQSLMKEYPERVQLKAVSGAITAFSQFIDYALPENQWLYIDTVLKSQRFAPHLISLITKIETLNSEEKIIPIFKTGNDLLKLGLICVHHCVFNSAKRYFEYSLETFERIKEPDEVAVATTCNHLGSVHEELGDFEQAKKLHYRALEILQKLGSGHVDVATTYSHLGRVYQRLGDFAQAKTFYESAQVIQLEKLGPEHVDVAANYSHLGSVYQSLDDFERAKGLHQFALDIQLKKLGPEHVNVAATYSNLGSVYQTLGDFERAINYYQFALNILLKKLGPEHVTVADIYNDLGCVYQKNLGNFEQAKQFHHLALNIQQKKLGPQHVDVAATYIGLGSVYRRLGDFEQAENFYRSALDIQLEKLGPEHANVAATYSCLGCVYQNSGDFEKAKTFHRLALDIQLKKLGSKHVNVAAILSNLGSVNKELGDLKQAKDLYHSALEIQEMKYGPKHVNVAATYSSLGSVYQRLGDFEQAKKFQHLALDIQLKKLGSKHVSVAATLCNLGSVYKELGDLKQAKDLYHDALEIERMKRGPEHVNVATIYSSLGSVYQRLGDFEQAKEFDHRALNIRKLGPGHVNVAATCSNLGCVNEKLGDLKQANEFHHRALTVKDVDVLSVPENMVAVEQELAPFSENNNPSGVIEKKQRRPVRSKLCRIL